MSFIACPFFWYCSIKWTFSDPSFSEGSVCSWPSTAWFCQPQSYPVSFFLTKWKSPSVLNLTLSGSGSITSNTWAAHLRSFFHSLAHFWDVEPRTADITQEVVHHDYTQSQNYALCLALSIFLVMSRILLAFWTALTHHASDFRALWIRISRSPFW